MGISEHLIYQQVLGLKVINYVLKRVVYIVSLILLLFPMSPAKACLWDSDTLMMERQRFPETLELITGKFIHHSQAYYVWRIQDRLGKLAQDPDNLLLQDDLAVAYDKTGQSEKAIETAKSQLVRHPGRYESLANLGTFYILDGKLEEGLGYINTALKINPNAHFGRERYQKYLIEYILARGNQLQPIQYLDSKPVFANYRPGFADYLIEHNLMASDKAEVERAIKAVLGMMRFADYKNPILLEALGSLLMTSAEFNARQLAARAYLSASEFSVLAERKALYRTIAATVLMEQTGTNFAKLQSDFQTERNEADHWFQQIVNDEKQWIKQDADVDTLFSQKYYQEPYISFPFGSLFDWLVIPVSPYLWLLIPIGILGLYYRFQPKDLRGRGLKTTLFDLGQGQLSLPVAFFFYFLPGLFVLSIFNIVAIYLMARFNWLLQGLGIVGISLLPIFLVRGVWLSGKKSGNHWRWLSRIAAVSIVCLYLGFFLNALLSMQRLD